MSRVLVDSGVSWLGKIPDSWSTCRVKNKFLFHKIIAKEKSVNYDRIALTLNGVIKRDKDDSNGLQPDNYNGYQVVYKDDLIFKLIDLENVNTSRIGKSEYEGITSPAYLVLTDKCNTRYSLYYFLNMWYQEIFNNIGGDGVRSAINKDDLLKVPFINISIDEQNKIANYLDKQCAKIDEIINDNNREVELLQEYKSNFISKVIEKGMTGGVKKIDNKYISSIPNNSSLVMLKQITNLITDGTHQTPTYISDGIPFLSIKDISSGIIDLSNCKYISNEEHKALSKHANIEKNDLLFCRIGTLGKSIVVEEKFLPFDIFVSLGLIKIKKEIINPYYLKYVMESNYYKEYIEVVKIDGGVSAAKFNLSSVKSSPIILPKLDEQNLIVKYLNKQCSKLDQVIKYRKQIIEKLEEYKKSLIYECVTGKREV